MGTTYQMEPRSSNCGHVLAHHEVYGLYGAAVWMQQTCGHVCTSFMAGMPADGACSVLRWTILLYSSAGTMSMLQYPFR